MKEIAHELNYDLTFHCSHNPLGMPKMFRVLGVYNFATTASFHILAVGMDFTKILTQDKGGIEKWAWPDGRMEKRKWSHKFRTGFFLCNCHLLLTLVKTAKVCQKICSKCFKIPIIYWENLLLCRNIILHLLWLQCDVRQNNASK